MIPLRILIVDDNQEFIQAAMHYFENIQEIHKVVSVSDGMTALKEFDIVSPHLVLVDFTMPGMNGLETTRLLKARAAGVRLIMLSVEDSAEHRQAAYEAGADAFVAKSEFASQIVRTILRLTEHIHHE